MEDGSKIDVLSGSGLPWMLGNRTFGSSAIEDRMLYNNTVAKLAALRIIGPSELEGDRTLQNAGLWTRTKPSPN